MKATLSILTASIILVACADVMGKKESAPPEAVAMAKPAPVGTTAAATLRATDGNKASGNVRFTQQASSVLVEASIQGLTPGPHGIHVHEKGDCSAPDGASAGAHFNPTGSAHGGTSGARHSGDMGNLVADAQGAATLKVNVTGIALNDGPSGVINRSVIVHADPDDFKTQPSGNSGKRVACGVVAKS